MKNQEHSNKNCWCGGHNHKNRKKNKRHNSTKRRLSQKINRKFISEMKGK